MGGRTKGRYLAEENVLLTLIISATGWHPAHGGSRDEAAIRALIDRWTKAAHEKNVDGVMSIYQRAVSCRL
jgi:hypothetical protein